MANKQVSKIFENVKGGKQGIGIAKGKSEICLYLQTVKKEETTTVKIT